MKIKIFDKLIEIRSPVRIINLPTIETWGITNRTSDNFFVLFLDYDHVEESVVYEDINFLQKNYDIGSVLIRCTSFDYSKDNETVGNFHVIGFTKFTFPEIAELIRLSRCDRHFKIAGLKYQQRAWVLRIGEKVDLTTGEVIKPAGFYYDFVKSKTKKEANSGLIKLFSKIDDPFIKENKIKKYFPKLDGLYDVEFIKYVTR